MIKIGLTLLTLIVYFWCLMILSFYIDYAAEAFILNIILGAGLLVFTAFKLLKNLWVREKYE